MYAPETENEAVVFKLAAFAKVTAPGPLTLLQLTVRTLPVGSPSSEADPERDAVAGNAIIWSRPALTTGALFEIVDGLTTTTTSSIVDRAPSLAVSRSV